MAHYGVSPSAAPHCASATSKGIGLAFVRELIASPDNLVIASCRDEPKDAPELCELQKSAKGTLHIIKIDMSDFDNIRASASELTRILGDTGLDYFISNAGIVVWDSAFDCDPEDTLSLLRTNTLGPALLAQVVLPFLERGRAKKILYMSSTTGSLACLTSDPNMKLRPHLSYGMSKTALNVLFHTQSVERPDLTILGVCPGWVKTDMGGEGAHITPEESVKTSLDMIINATQADSGKFLEYTGKEIPW
ncbi:NAD-P-binding protein [Lenzites betulinus]|nr:NAD-P-binding protein [Lenzites betulinus]